MRINKCLINSADSIDRIYNIDIVGYYIISKILKCRARIKNSKVSTSA